MMKTALALATIAPLALASTAAQAKDMKGRFGIGGQLETLATGGGDKNAPAIPGGVSLKYWIADFGIQAMLGLGIRNAVAAQVRTIEHCSFMVPDGVHYEQPVADEVAEKGIYVCPTFGVGERARQWMEQEGIDNPFAATRNQRVDSLRKLWDTGVKFVSGNDAGVTMTRFDDFQLDLELLVEHVGASSAQAIRTGTSQAAEAIGSDDFGSLAPGKRADILAVRGNAMDDIGALRNILLVLKSGQAMVDNA